jgi:hypothetical protein
MANSRLMIWLRVDDRARILAGTDEKMVAVSLHRDSAAAVRVKDTMPIWEALLRAYRVAGEL